MKATILITITDDTPEEQLVAAGFSQASTCELYKDSFSKLLREAVDPRAKWELLVSISDNTKEDSTK